MNYHKLGITTKTKHLCTFTLLLHRMSGLIFMLGFAGYSHKPEEFSSVEDIANGVKVLALTLAKLSLS